MRTSFRFRLYPTSGQRTAMQAALDACRWTYNKTLEVRRDAWKDRQESLSLYATNKLLTEWKREKPDLTHAFSQCLQDAQARVDLAFQHFFRRVRNGDVPGYPRFRSKERYDSFTYKQAWNGFELTEGSRLRLAKIGNVKIKLHRPIEGQVKTLTIRRDQIGNWYACFSCEVESHPLPPVPHIVGIDMGLANFATFSTGEQVDNPRFFRHDERALAKAQRKLSNTAKGTSAHTCRKRVVQHIYARITNRRKDFAHQLSRRIVNSYQLIVFEDLNVTGMVKNHCLAKSVSDAAWNQLIEYTTYKAADAGRRVVLVDPRNTSKACSRCGMLVEKDLSVRVHACPHCGLIIDRDLNASLNILARGLASLGENP